MRRRSPLHEALELHNSNRDAMGIAGPVMLALTTKYTTTAGVHPRIEIAPHFDHVLRAPEPKEKALGMILMQTAVRLYDIIDEALTNGIYGAPGESGLLQDITVLQHFIDLNPETIDLDQRFGLDGQKIG